MSKESSITVAVRVRPFTPAEERNLIVQSDERPFVGDGAFAHDPRHNGELALPGATSPLSYYSPRGIRRIVSCVDDRMLIFDPPETNPLAHMQQRAFPGGSAKGGASGSGSRIREHRFVFDRLFDASAGQQDVYEQTTKPLLDSVLDGFNATIFAYGATGCGKTHTILGSLDLPGVIFLTMQELFQRIDELKGTKHVDISLLYLEIYNETIRDLLSPETSFKKLVIREDSQQKILVSHLSTHRPELVQQVMDLIMFGNANRTSSPTEANLTLSRSHAVLQINVMQKPHRMIEMEESQTFATFSIIDLAGSERAAATKNRGVRLNEGANINKSLLALGNCINALCDPRRKNHVPYRDSKLTRLLKFSLGGNCKTVMIVCISPSLQHYDETLNTLKYADRAKEIKTKVIRNQRNLDRHVGSYLKMITEQRQEIEELRSRQDKAIHLEVQKHSDRLAKCLQLTIEAVDAIQKSLARHTQEKWRKYHLLAKRKLLLLQKVEAELLVEEIKSHPIVNDTFVSLLEQLVQKTSVQVTDLENRYSAPNDALELIFSDLYRVSLNRLKELDGWTDDNTVIFTSLVSSVKNALDREILFNSSVLFDYLIHYLEPFSLGLVNLQQTGDMASQTEDLLITKLENLINGEYDAMIEEHTSAFVRLKLSEEEVLTSCSQPDRPQNLRRDSKRDSRSRSPLKSSPPTKRLPPASVLSKIAPPNFASSNRKIQLRPPGVSATAATTINDSDTSMDEQSLFLEDNFENHSTSHNGDLDLSFNPTIESPPSNSKLAYVGQSVLAGLRQSKHPTNISIKSFLNQKKDPPERAEQKTTQLKMKEASRVSDSHAVLPTEP